MQTLQKISPKKLAPADSAILSAYQQAVEHGQKYATYAIICGQLLNEKKAALPHGDWGKWLEKNFAGKHRDTVCRWMNAADRVVQQALSSCANCQLTTGAIDVESEVLPLSQVLTMAEADVPEGAREARQMFFDFTSDKTIADCLRDVADGSSPDHRITRAANGKGKGGTRGEDRKDFPLFTLVKFHDINSHLGHWNKLNATQQTELKAVIRAAIIGDSVKLAGRDKDMVNFKAWPQEFAEVALEALKERMKGAKR